MSLYQAVLSHLVYDFLFGGREEIFRGWVHGTGEHKVLPDHDA